MSEPPSGGQYEIRFAEQRAIVVEVGAGLRQYEAVGQPILDGYSVDEIADGSRGQPLLPWPNRIVDGQYDFDGQSLQLPIEEVGRHNAIHGLTRWQNWRLLEQAESRVRLGLTIHPRPGYPFGLLLEIEYALDSSGLVVRTTARNIGARALPFGAGQHPYLTAGGPRIDGAALGLPAAGRLEMDEQHRVPMGTQLPTAGTEYDFGSARPIGGLVLDDCFTDLARDEHGIARVTLSENFHVTVWMDRRYRYVQAFTGETLVESKRRRSLAIEPMTCPPNAFRTGVDLIVLAPEEQVTLEWGITPGSTTT